jgi:hypothetical protein
MSRPVLLTSRPARAVSVFAFAAASCGAAGFMLAAAATPALDTAPAVASLMTPGVLAALDMRGLGSTAAMSLPAVASVCHAFVAATGVFTAAGVLAAAVLGLGSAAAAGLTAMSLPAVTSVCHAIVAATSVLAAAGFALMRAAATVVAAPLVVGPRRRAGREQDPERERHRQSRHLPWCVHTIAP